MARKRGSPVLIELMNTREPETVQTGEPSLRLAPAEMIEPKPRPGQQLVGMAMPPRAGASPLFQSGPLAVLGKIQPMAWMGLGVVIVLVAVVWLVAFRTGQSDQAKLDEQRRARELTAGGTPAPVTPGNIGTTPGGNQGSAPTVGPNTLPDGAGQGGVPQPAPIVLPAPPKKNEPVKPTVAGAVVEADDQLVQGMNYLVCGVFKRQDDADKSAEFLKSRGLPAAIVPAREFSSSAGAKDVMVIIKKGYARDKYAASGMREKVQSLGRLWRAEDRRAPTDFAQPYWDKYK